MDSITKGMPFPERINQTPLSLYARGMTGWGEKYEPFLTTAKETTGLTVEQIMVFFTTIALSRYLHYLTTSILRDGFVGGIESDGIMPPKTQKRFQSSVHALGTNS